MDTPSRVKYDLSGRWNYSVGGGPTGTVLVPSAFDFAGTVTFDRQFTITAEDLDRYQFHLVMYGVNHAADIAVNGEFLTSHAGGSTSFVQPIPRNLLQMGKENTIRIAVSNVLDPKRTMPLKPGVWRMRNYGGITRDVYLLGTPILYLKDAVIESELHPGGTSARITARASIEGPDITQQTSGAQNPARLGFVMEVVDKISGSSVGRSEVVPLLRNGEEWQEIQAQLLIADPKVWSPETPELYLVRCFLVSEQDEVVSTIDELDVNHGIRAMTIHGGDFVLNGKRLILKGLLWYEDHPLWGSALPYEQMERDVIMMKNLGANVIRFADHPPHPYLLNLCDRYGLLAMEELPLRTPEKLMEEESYLELAVTMMKEMVQRDRNHVSVLAWGVGDGFGVMTDGSRRFVDSVVRVARSMDTRPLYYGTRQADGDRCADLTDIAVLTVDGGDAKTFKAELERLQTLFKNKPVIVGRFGSEVQQENRNGYADRLSQQAQARFFFQRFEIIRTVDMDGGIVWSFNDWRGDRPAMTVNSGDPWLHSMGLVSAAREKRLAYDAVYSVFHAEKFPALPAGSSSGTAPIVYVLAGFAVLVTAAYMYNASRRFRESMNRALVNSYNFFADVRDQHVVSIVHTTMLGLMVSVAAAIVTSSLLYHFRQNLFLDDLLSILLVFDGLKVVIVDLIWSPLKFILLFSLVLFAGLLLCTLFVIALRLLLKTRVLAFHAYTITMWSTVPYMILIPIGMILYRIMESPVYVMPALAIYAGLTIWVFFRFLKGISVIFDVHPVKIYSIGTAVMLIAGVGLYFFYDAFYSLPMYVSFLAQTTGGAR